MKGITKFEDAIRAQVKNLKELGINHTLFWAYRQSRENGNELVDFNEVIWDEDIKENVETLRENDITEFTISSTFSSLIPTLAAFEKLGCKMAGLTQTRSSHRNFRTDEYDLIHAIKMSL